MKTDSVPVEAICPKCGKVYRGHPALSREDNSTAICPDCGIREALASLGCDPEAQEKILDMIHTNNEQREG